MTDLYEASIRRMSEYLIAKLNGSDSSFEEFDSYENPSNFIIVGSLANRLEENDGEISSTKSRDTSLAVKYKLKSLSDYSVKVHYSIFQEVLVSGTDKKHHWKRHDLVYDLNINESNKAVDLPFSINGEQYPGYNATVEYSHESRNGVILSTIRVTIVNSAR